MAEIVAEGLSKRFGRRATVADVSLHVADGQMLVLLGPSGCGKTTTLRCLAGLEEPDTGVVRFGGHTVFDRAGRLNVPLHRRDIGFVFQSYALWPHLSAYRNIAFPLRSRRVPAAERDRRVRDVAQLLDLGDELLAKRPGQLSGGQQQRVALARALVAEPAVVLFDEPLSNLDARLREQLRSELRSLHRRIGFTGVYVTHDLAEALALGDRVAVMRQGRVEQVGHPIEVYRSPGTRATATLLGFRSLGTVRRGADGWTVPDGGVLRGRLPARREAPDEVELFVRPDRVSLVRPGGGAPDTVGLCGATVDEVVPLGSHTEVSVILAGARLRLVDQSGRMRPGDPVDLVAAGLDLQVYAPDGKDWTERAGSSDNSVSNAVSGHAP